MEARVFKWACLGLGAIAVGGLLWLLNDVRAELARTNATVNAQLPAIVDNVRQGTATLANVSQDIEALRDLVGLTSTPSDRSLIRYADSILDFLEAQPGAQIGLAKVVGSGLKDTLSAADWARDSRKEALWLTFRASSKRELLERLAANKFGAAWHFTAPGIAPLPLLDFLRLNHPDSKGL